MTPSGAARTEIDIIDLSVLINTALKGKTGFLGVTERGVPGRLYDIGSWEQYQIELGGLVSGNDFPLYCKRCLEAGGPLIISPAGKYLDPANPTSLVGDKAVFEETQAAAAAAGAEATTTLSSVSIPTTDEVSLIVRRPGQTDLVIASAVPLTSTDTVATATVDIVAAVNAGTGTHGFSAVGTSGPITVTAPTSLGAWGNNLTLNVLAGTGLVFTAYNPAFSGGTDTTVVTGEVTISALTRGTKYNDVNVIFSSAISSDPTKYDITLRLLNSTVPDEVIRDVPKLASDAAFAGKINELVSNSRLVSSMVFSDDYVLQPGTFALTGGTNGAAMSPNDYIGDRSASTGFYAFDNTAEPSKICIPAVADPVLAKALADYVDDRKDLMGLHRVPLGISPQRTLDYRYGTGSYDHIPIDSWRNLMFDGEISITDPLTGIPRTISAIGDIAACIAKKDTQYHEWFSFAGETRGRIKNVLDVPKNVGTPGTRTYADAYDNAGIIPVIKDAKKLVYICGDNSLQMDATLLKSSNIGELVVYIFRSVMQLVKTDFPPNDVEQWKVVYRTVQPFFEYLKNNRALYDYVYNGDQDVMDVSQAVVNQPENIDAGMYKAQIGIKPIRTMKYIWFTIGIFNSGFDFSDISFD